MKDSTIEKIVGGVLIASTIADGISVLFSGNRIGDYIPIENLSGMYQGLTQVGPALVLGTTYLFKKD